MLYNGNMDYRVIYMKDKITLYRSSINNFIIENIENQGLADKRDDLIKNDHILSIIALTLINSLNRKNRRTAHGYNIAFAISLLSIYRGEAKLLCSIIRFLDENLLILATQISSDNKKSYRSIDNTARNNDDQNTGATVNNNSLLPASSVLPVKPTSRLDNETHDHLTFDKIITINCLAHEILFKLLSNLTEGRERIITLSKLTLLIGWITGCGLLNKEILADLETAGDNLGNLVYISNNFNKDNYNEDFDMFVQYKQKYIEIMITYDIFSDTMKNIVNMYEENIDRIVSTA